MNTLELVGIGSALLALVAFISNQYHLWGSDNIWYDLFNFVSAAGLLYYAVKMHAVPFIITNTVWGVVSGIDVVRFFSRPRR